MRAFALAVLVGLAVARVDVASATRALPVSIDQLTRNASVILEGEVTAVHGDWNSDRNRIYTTVSIRVDQFHKGALTTQVVDLRYLGGTVDDVTMAVFGQPTFEPNERVFVFLKANFDQRDVPVVGNEAGKFRMATSAQGDVLLGPTQTYEKSDVVREIRSVLRPIGQ
jgi:hypothetical protein